MLELGVFGGAYFGLDTKEYPKSWFINAKVSKKFDVNLNRFKVKSGLSRKEWQEKGWIGFSLLDFIKYSRAFSYLLLAFSILPFFSSFLALFIRVSPFL